MYGDIMFAVYGVVIYCSVWGYYVLKIMELLCMIASRVIRVMSGIYGVVMCMRVHYDLCLSVPGYPSFPLPPPPPPHGYGSTGGSVGSGSSSVGGGGVGGGGAGVAHPLTLNAQTHDGRYLWPQHMAAAAAAAAAAAFHHPSHRTAG